MSLAAALDGSCIAAATCARAHPCQHGGYGLDLGQEVAVLDAGERRRTAAVPGEERMLLRRGLLQLSMPERRAGVGGLAEQLHRDEGQAELRMPAWPSELPRQWQRQDQPARGRRSRPASGPAACRGGGRFDTATGPAHYMKRCSCDTSFGEASPRTQATDPTGRETLRIRTPFPGLRGKARWLRRRAPASGRRATPWGAKALTSQGCLPGAMRLAFSCRRCRGLRRLSARLAGARVCHGRREATQMDPGSSSPGRRRPRIRVCSFSHSGTR